MTFQIIITWKDRDEETVLRNLSKEEADTIADIYRRKKNCAEARVE